MTHWPSGARDTTEFPSLEIEVSANLREHLKAFISMDGIDWSNNREQAEAGNLSVTDQRIRSYRKMYEKLGLIYRDRNDTLRLSRLGLLIRNMEPNLISEKNKIFSEMMATAISILSRYQLKNPADNNELPSSCDVQPCICIWTAMLELDGKLHYEEMNRVILRIMNMSELQPAIDKIAQSRMALGSYRGQSEQDLERNLGTPVHTNQPRARIDPWYSFAGWGGLIIRQQCDEEGFRHLNDLAIPIVQDIINDPPSFYHAADSQDWFNYYIGDAAKEDSTINEVHNLVEDFHRDLLNAGLNYEKDFITRFLSSCLSKPFVIFTGLAGSGKTKLSQAFAKWITEQQVQSDPFTMGAEVVADRTTYYVKNSDDLSVELWNSLNEEEAIRVVLPRQLIGEWVQCIKDNGFNRSTSARTIREKVAETTKFSTQLNSFETHFKAAAFAVLAQENREEATKDFEIVSVGADWTSKDNILGYADALDPQKYIRTQALDILLKAYNNPHKPHFLILDEMNLSHVERYFADILSAIESNEPIYLHGDMNPRENVPPFLKQLPSNLIIIGTVNIDETTYMFSPKVLDRANVIEFKIKKEEISSFLDNPHGINLSVLTGLGKNYGGVFSSAVNEITLENENKKKLKEEILLLFDILSELGIEFGFRTVKEMARFLHFHKQLSPTEWKFENAMDAQILQKVLPKLHGSRKKLEPILCALASVCYEEHNWSEDHSIVNKEDLKKNALNAALLVDFQKHPLALNQEGKFITRPENAYYTLSYNKIIRMLKQLEQVGFTSFAEA